MTPLAAESSDLADPDRRLLEELLKKADELLGSRQEAKIEQSLALAIQAIDVVELHEPEFPDHDRLLARAWLTKANSLREFRQPAARADALAACRAAMRHFENSLVNDPAGDANFLAEIWTTRGLTLLDDGSPPALSEALPCFDKALELRQKFPLEDESHFAWETSAAWLNCAEVLTKLGGPAELAAAVASYDSAIGLLEKLPPEERPALRGRLALAWCNRGLTCQAMESRESLQEGIRSFSESIQQYEKLGGRISHEQRKALACAHLHRGNALMECAPPEALQARQDAARAMSPSVEFEKIDLEAAHSAMQARHLFCRATASLIEQQNLSGDWISETTDMVEDGMALARHCRQQGTDILQDLEIELFRFGAFLYRTCQPQFLLEFILDSLDPERSEGAAPMVPEMHELAADAIWRRVVDIHAMPVEALSAEKQARDLKELQEIQDAEWRLVELRKIYLEQPEK